MSSLEGHLGFLICGGGEDRRQGRWLVCSSASGSASPNYSQPSLPVFSPRPSSPFILRMCLYMVASVTILCPLAHREGVVDSVPATSRTLCQVGPKPLYPKTIVWVVHLHMRVLCPTDSPQGLPASLLTLFWCDQDMYQQFTRKLMESWAYNSHTTHPTSLWPWGRSWGMMRCSQTGPVFSQGEVDRQIRD